MNLHLFTNKLLATINYSFEQVSAILRATINKTVDAAMWVFNNTIIPVWNYSIRPAVIKVSEVMQSVSADVIEKTQKLFANFYQAIVIPTIAGTRKAISIAEEKAVFIFEKISKLWETLAPNL